MSGPADDVPSRRRGALPPRLATGDSPMSVDVPRLDPLPPSLQAMVEGVGHLQRPLQASSSRWVWVVAGLVALALTVYVAR